MQFNHFLVEIDLQVKANLKADILGYNYDDVIATRWLEEWLRAIFMSRLPIFFSATRLLASFNIVEESPINYENSLKKVSGMT